MSKGELISDSDVVATNGQCKCKQVEDVKPLPTDYMFVDNPRDAVCINAVRVLTPALPLQAKSGHPGAPMGCALIAHALWGNIMRYSPKDPKWAGRDFFVLSNGHACALQYVMLHLTGYEVSLDDLKNFRQLKSITPGHPEANHTPGVDVTTGPLGQGVAQAVGIAIASLKMAAEFNRPNFTLYDNYIYCILGDGCLQEGVASEASSLAGHLGLGNLICFYDSNEISIDGHTKLSFTENVVMRYESYGWHVITVQNGNQDLMGVYAGVESAKAMKDKPSLIVVRTIIGYGSAMQGTAKAHGSPMGEADIKALREKCGMSADLWDIPGEALQYYREAGCRGDGWRKEWEGMLVKYGEAHPELKSMLDARYKPNYDEIISKLPKYTEADPPQATRDSSERMLNVVAEYLPGLVGGSADLTESNKTQLKKDVDFQKDSRTGRYIRFGVREHAMVAISNGIFAFGGFRPFCATFLNFYTYAWGAVRLTALSKMSVLMIASHDSVELGEDGPTHQPIETAALMRATPNLLYVRPCDGNETAGAYAVWLREESRPTVVALSRGKVPQMKGTSVEQVRKGAYILQDYENNGNRKICIAGSGTETCVAVGAAERLRSEGKDVRVVSMPCWELFEEQPEQYRKSVLPRDPQILNVYVEAATTFGMARYFEEEASMGLSTFGDSAPAAKLQEFFGFTPEAVATKINKWLNTHA